MEQFDKIKQYTKTVCEQIRWKKAHTNISEEIESHIIDQKEAYLLSGMDEVTATDNAIKQMGDPVVVGTQLDRTHRPKAQWTMLSLTVVLVLIGYIINTYMIHEPGFPTQKRVFLSVFIGLGVMLIAYFLDFSIIAKYPRLVYAAIILFAIVIFLASPRYIGGAAFYTVYASLLFPLAFAAIIYWARGKGYLGIILCGISVLLPALITISIPSAASFLLLVFSGLILLSIAIYKNWFAVNKLFGYLLVYIPTLIAFALMLINLLYRLGIRLRVAFDPSIDPLGYGWQGSVAKALLDNSKLIGTGTMPTQYKDLQGFFPLPGIDTDFSLTYLIFKFGWIAFIVIMAIIVLFIAKGFILSLKQKSTLGLLVSLSVVLTFTLQAVGYVLTNLGFILFAPISLPLVSYGNTATIINMALIGLMLSVFRTGSVVNDSAPIKASNSDFITWAEGKLIINFGKKSRN